MLYFFFSSRRRHTRYWRDWSSDVCSSDLTARATALEGKERHEFHLSTNYRNSAEIYAYAAAYARRVGLDADLPTAGPSTGADPGEPARGNQGEAPTRGGGARHGRPGARPGRNRGAGAPPPGGDPW